MMSQGKAPPEKRDFGFSDRFLTVRSAVCDKLMLVLGRGEKQITGDPGRGQLPPSLTQAESCMHPISHTATAVTEQTQQPSPPPMLCICSVPCGSRSSCRVCWSKPATCDAAEVEHSHSTRAGIHASPGVSYVMAMWLHLLEK